jgi:hypothetical protein
MEETDKFTIDSHGHADGSPFVLFFIGMGTGKSLRRARYKVRTVPANGETIVR